MLFLNVCVYNIFYCVTKKNNKKKHTHAAVCTCSSYICEGKAFLIVFIFFIFFIGNIDGLESSALTPRPTSAPSSAFTNPTFWVMTVSVCAIGALIGYKIMKQPQ